MEELIKKLDSFGYKVEDCSDWTPNWAKWKYIITKKNDPRSSWQPCKDKNDVQKFLDYLEASKQMIEKEKEQEKTDGVPRDEVGTILCQLIKAFIPPDNNLSELYACALVLTGNRGYVEHTDKAHRHMLIHCKGLSKFGERFVLNSGSHYIHCGRASGFADADWYTASRLTAREEKYHELSLREERKKREMLNKC